MCKLYEFPVKKELSDEMKGYIDKMSEGYVKLMIKALDEFCGDNPTEEEYLELMELVIAAYVESLEKAIDKLL